ncbi:integrase core domain-containing protein [Streptomyces sp. NPDC050844]|uniref:integrase core domain-containing protein n=1 Tax=Streptomyces sp. NPDC050844 TaxID=3155790 RepID=UPI0033C84FA1
MNTHCERVIGTVRREDLDHVLIMHEAHARQVLADYQDNYSRHRPHRSRDQRPPQAHEQPAAVNDCQHWATCGDAAKHPEVPTREELWRDSQGTRRGRSSPTRPTICCPCRNVISSGDVRPPPSAGALSAP